MVKLIILQKYLIQKYVVKSKFIAKNFDNLMVDLI